MFYGVLINEYRSSFLNSNLQNYISNFLISSGSGHAENNYLFNYSKLSISLFNLVQLLQIVKHKMQIRPAKKVETFYV